METYPDTRADRLQEMLDRAFAQAIDPTLPAVGERIIVFGDDDDPRAGQSRPAIVTALVGNDIHYKEVDPVTDTASGRADMVRAFTAFYIRRLTRPASPYPVDVESVPAIFRVQPADLVDLGDVPPTTAINRAFRDYWQRRIDRLTSERRDTVNAISGTIAGMVAEYRRLFAADPEAPRFVIDGSSIYLTVATPNDVGAPRDLTFAVTERRSIRRLMLTTVCPDCNDRVAVSSALLSVADLGAFLFDGDATTQALHEHYEYCPARVSRETLPAPAIEPVRADLVGVVRDIVGTVLIERGLIPPEY